MAPCPGRAASQARGRAFSYVLGFANSGFGEPTLGPFKAAFRAVKRSPAPPRLDLWSLIAGRHAQLVERTRAERDALVVDVLAQFFAGQERLWCWRGRYWIGHDCHLFQNPGNSGKATEQSKDLSRLHKWAVLNSSQLRCPLCRLRLRPLRARVSAFITVSREQGILNSARTCIAKSRYGPSR